MTINLAAARRIEALEAKVRPPIADVDVPATIEARLAPHLSRGVTLVQLAEGDGSDAELARLLLSAMARRMLEDAEAQERERALG